MPFRWGRSALGFWAASLAGFVAHGWSVAAATESAMGPPWLLGEAVSTALALALVAALALGAPAALLFCTVMRRVRCGAQWPAAVITGALLSAALYLALRSLAGALVACDPPVLLAASAAAMMAGAVAGTAAGRRAPAPADVRGLAAGAEPVGTGGL